MRFHYDPVVRRIVRRSLKLSDDTLVVGHVGRFSLQKNHAFLVDVFEQIHRQQPDSVLLLVGAGELEEEIRKGAGTGTVRRCTVSGTAERHPGFDECHGCVCPAFFL